MLHQPQIDWRISPPCRHMSRVAAVEALERRVSRAIAPADDSIAAGQMPGGNRASAR